MTEEQIGFAKIRRIVKEEITAGINDYLRPVIKYQELAPEMISTKELCTQLKVSRQTINNWLKNNSTKAIIENNRQKIGNKVWYNLTGIKEIMAKNPRLFGGGREYEYLKKSPSVSIAEKCVVKTDDDRYQKIYYRICQRKMRISEQNLEWFKNERFRKKNPGLGSAKNPLTDERPLNEKALFEEIDNEYFLKVFEQIQTDMPIVTTDLEYFEKQMALRNQPANFENSNTNVPIVSIQSGDEIMEHEDFWGLYNEVKDYIENNEEVIEWFENQILRRSKKDSNWYTVFNITAVKINIITRRLDVIKAVRLTDL
jgi:hypothetical protein